MISTIRLQNCVPFHNEEMTECKKVNFIYGANGSGKSTVCSFLGGKYDERYAESSIKWDNAEHETIYVYNRDFRIRNIKENIPGVFTLGSATIDQINEIENLKEELNYKKEKLESITTKYNEQVNVVKPKRENDFKEEVWKHIYKSTDPDLQSAFQGLRNSKEKFAEEVKNRMYDNANNADHRGSICDTRDLLTRAKMLFVAKPTKCQRFEYEIDSSVSKINEIKNESLWDTVIAGNKDIDIAELINSLGNSSWVNQGIKYIKPGSMACPFCQQETITESFKHKIEAFFDDKYSQRIEQMNTYLNDYLLNVEEIYRQFDDLTNNKEAVKFGGLDIGQFSKTINYFKEQYTKNVDSIKKKILEPGIKIQITDVSTIIRDLEKMIDNANDLIDDQNSLIDQKEKQESKLVDDIWATAIHNSEGIIKSYKSNIKTINKKIEELNKSRKRQEKYVNEAESVISEKSNNVTSIEPAIKNINDLLKAYGFTNFHIDPSDDKDNSYCIRRNDGTLVNDSLSEGEETFLTFLYFMQYIKGSTDPGKVAEKKIIVLDDPICSLDSTVLYVVSSMVRDLVKNVREDSGDVKQLFVFTHNVLFHKEASFIRMYNQEIKDIHYWIIRKGDMYSAISAYGCNNPISTSYELLWKELRDNKSLSHVAMQNIMRRIIENYFRLLGKDRDEKLIENLQSDEDRIIGRSLILWMNEGSHYIPDDLFANSYSDDVEKYRSVFKDIFYKNGSKEHYDMMMLGPG